LADSPPGSAPQAKWQTNQVFYDPSVVGRLLSETGRIGDLVGP
jgi:hypothetical protein